MKYRTFALVLISLLLFVIISGFAFTGYSVNKGKSETKGRVILEVDVLGSANQKIYDFENITALELLQKENNVNLTYSKYGAFVECINSICSDNNNYWMYYVNGEMAPVGAGDYSVRNNDTIEFKYGKI